VGRDQGRRPKRVRRAAQLIALGRPVKPPAEVVAVILAEKWGVLPSVILESDFGDVIRWWTITALLNEQKGGKRGG
jgi:hypothetical protein